MPRRNVSVGFLKLSHRHLVSESSVSTRFPESRSFNVLFVDEDGSSLEDQRLLDAYSTTTFPSSAIRKTPLESATGSSLLATHTTVCGSSL